MPTADRFSSRDARLARRFARLVTAVVSLTLVASGVAHAQVVRGVVVDSVTGRPVPGVVVVLVDGGGKRVVAVIAGDDGRYAVRTTSPGQYGLRAERIGFRAAAPRPVALRAGETVEVRLVTNPLPVTLTSVRVTGRTACVARAEGGEDVSAVWEEARKALLATDVTQRDELFTVKVSRFERTLEPRTSKVLTYETKQSTGATKSPFVAIPAARLSADGFVRQNASETIYYGPDASVLLSDEFLNDHCFRLRSGRDGRSALIGLDFEPVRGRDKPDIAGTLWIDRQSSELRDIEYSYTLLPNLPANVRSADFGGRVEFHRMPTGAWIVERWMIRMPVVVERGLSLPTSGAVMPGVDRPAERLRLAAVREEGGEVLESIARSVRRELAVDQGSVRGVVFDSTRMVPLASARVFLDGTQFSARTGADGAFVLENVPPGTYALSVVHGRFDSLGVRPPSQPVTLVAGETPAVHLASPSAATLIARDCKPAERGPGTAALRGRVREETSGAPGIGVEVVATWNRLAEAGRTARVSAVAVRTRTDSSGRYELCGLPERVQVTLRAVADRRRSAPARLLLPEGQISIVDMALSASEAVVAAMDSLSQASAVAKAAGQAEATDNTAMAGVASRRRLRGAHLTRLQIEKANASQITGLLRAMSGVTLRPNESGIPIIEVRHTKRLTPEEAGFGRGSGAGQRSGSQPGAEVSPDRCPALIRIDGIPMENNGITIDGTIHPETLDAIEAYSGAQVPLEFVAPGSHCGMVLIWTRRSADAAAPGKP